MKKKNKKKEKNAYSQDPITPHIIPVYEPSQETESIILESSSILKPKKNKSGSKSKSPSDQYDSSNSELVPPSTPVKKMNVDENVNLSQEDWNVMQHLMFSKKAKKGKHAEQMSSD